MRWTIRLVVLGALTASLLPVVTSSANAEIVSVLPCSPSSVRITEYNTAVGAGNVNDLFWIRNTSSTRCSLRGYVRTQYLGHYGTGTSGSTTKSLDVPQVKRANGGSNGNDFGGVRNPQLSTVVVVPNGVASFWIYGTDEPHHLENGELTRCITSTEMRVRLPGARSPVVVRAMKNSGFFWCGATTVHPIVAGRSGTFPPQPLTTYFGTPN